MTDSPTPPNAPQRRRATGPQTKALAGLVAIMVAAAIVALVFVTTGSGSTTGPQAGAQQRDVGRDSTASSAPATTSTPSTSAPTTASPSAPRTTPAASSSTSRSANPSADASSHSTRAKSITYTVKKGDNLTVIAAWFHQHGYGKLYDRNRAVIGDDPNLIFPGEKITISGGKMTTSS